MTITTKQYRTAYDSAEIVGSTLPKYAVTDPAKRAEWMAFWTAHYLWKCGKPGDEPTPPAEKPRLKMMGVLSE